MVGGWGSRVRGHSGHFARAKKLLSPQRESNGEEKEAE